MKKEKVISKRRKKREEREKKREEREKKRVLNKRIEYYFFNERFDSMEEEQLIISKIQVFSPFSFSFPFLSFFFHFLLFPFLHFSLHSIFLKRKSKRVVGPTRSSSFRLFSFSESGMSSVLFCQLKIFFLLSFSFSFFFSFFFEKGASNSSSKTLCYFCFRATSGSFNRG